MKIYDMIEGVWLKDEKKEEKQTEERKREKLRPHLRLEEHEEKNT